MSSRKLRARVSAAEAAEAAEAASASARAAVSKEMRSIASRCAASASLSSVCAPVTKLRKSSLAPPPAVFCRALSCDGFSRSPARISDDARRMIALPARPLEPRLTSAASWPRSSDGTLARCTSRASRRTSSFSTLPRRA